MDENLKYVKQQRIALLLNEMVIHLLSSRPQDPVTSLITYLEVKQSGTLLPGDLEAIGATVAQVGATSSSQEQPVSPAAAPSLEPTDTTPAPAEAVQAVEAQPEQLPTPAVPTSIAEEPATDVPSSAGQCALRFCVGCEVDVVGFSDSLDGHRARVVGTSRGRVGLEFYDDIPPQSVPCSVVRRVDSVQTVFPKGVKVVFTSPHPRAGWVGVVESHYRGRVGVVLEDGEVLGTVPSMLQKTVGDVRQSFPLGAVVELLNAGDAAGALGCVVGHARGRVGVELSCGTATQGCVPEALRVVDKTAAQRFPIGTHVECIDLRTPTLNGKTGVVEGHSRGRIGVVLDDGGTHGFLPKHLRRASGGIHINDEVEVTSPESAHHGLTGSVTSLHRGRLGILLSTGEAAGVLPQHIRKVNKPVSVGARVEILNGAGKLCGATGRVENVSRGRVGVSLSDGTVHGVPIGCVRVVANAAGIAKGSTVEVLSGPHVGVTGTVDEISRGRAGVTLAGGSVSFPLGMLRGIAADTARRMPTGSDVEVVGGTTHRGKVGQVTGQSRGRVGVAFQDGVTAGIPIQHLKVISKSAGQEFPVGCTVCVVAASEYQGQEGQVLGHSRGRVGVELPDKRIGVPASSLRKLGMSAPQSLPVGSYVDVQTHPTVGGRRGQVVSHSRGRVGVSMEDGTTLGLPGGCVRHVPADALQFPVGSRVDVISGSAASNGDSGIVTGHSRGRVGVELSDGTTTGLPASCLRSTPQDISRQYPVGASVMVVNEQPSQNGQLGSVIGHSRGRVGISLLDGTTIGVPSTSLRSAGDDPEVFPIGCFVCVINNDPNSNGNTAQVTGHSRGRVGLLLDDGRQISTPHQQVRRVARTAEQAFKKGVHVDILSGPHKGTAGMVTGTSRGRVGVEIGPGELCVGVPADVLRITNASAQQAFVVGAFVDVAGRVGRVSSHHRGRVAVTFSDGSTEGVPAGQVRPVKDLKMKIGSTVTIVNQNPAYNGEEGRVVGNARGRVGVELNDGRNIGLPIDQLRAGGRSAAQTYSEGDQVEITAGQHIGESGSVTHVHRGRVGVSIGNGNTVGVPAAQTRLLGKTPLQSMPIGSEVDFNGRIGRVTGHNRGRVGVEFENGERLGTPGGSLRPIGRTGPQGFPPGTEVCLSSESTYAGRTGRVQSSARGRLAVALENGEVVGVPSSQASAVASLPSQRFPTGAFVTIHSPGHLHNGADGRVVGTTRGRVGVELQDGTHIGLPAGQLKATGRSAAQSFSKGARVEVIAGNHKGESGVVTGTHRGRVGVNIGPENVIVGVPAESLRGEKGTAHQTFPVGIEVQIISGTHSGASGRVMGHNRGRAGVELSCGSLVGVPTEQLRVSGATPEQAFPLRTLVEVVAPPGAPLTSAGNTGVVIGHNRGRVSVLLDDQTEPIGVPASALRTRNTTIPNQGDAVEVVPEGLSGKMGAVSRGRAAVDTEDGEVRGYPLSQLRVKGGEGFPVGSVVHVVLASHAQHGQEGVVTEGTARGRVGVEIDGVVAGFAPSALRLARAADAPNPKQGDTIKYKKPLAKADEDCIGEAKVYILFLFLVNT